MMKPRNLLFIVILISILTLGYSLIPPKTIEYTEIEHGVTINTPDPNKGTLMSSSFYLRNNLSRTVLVSPFDYQYNAYSGHPFSLVYARESQNRILEMAPNETIILKQQTYVPRKAGLFTVEALGVKTSVIVDESWVPNNVQQFDDEFCIAKFIEITSDDGYEYWNVTIGPIEISPEDSKNAGIMTRTFSANTKWRDGTIYFPYAGLITEDLEIQYVRLS